MSKVQSKEQTARRAKRARFEPPANARPNRTPLIVASVVMILAVVVIAGGVLFALNQGASKASEASLASVRTRYTPVQATDGVVRWPLTAFDDGQAHFYSFVSAGKSIDFFIIRSSDGVVRAAFDACDVCYPARKGYRQQGDLMICNNCERQFPSVQINEVRGGCNPAPLERMVAGTDLVVRIADIMAGAGYF